MSRVPDGGREELWGLARLFTRLGFTAFGGPAAHIAMMRDEVVVRREWLSEQEFLDLVGAVNIIPGPSSTQLGIHIGRVRAGWRGLVVAGLCFIVPAALITLACAWAYVVYGATPAGESLLYGISPVIIAIVAGALWGLLGTAVKGPLTSGTGLVALGLYLSGVAGEIPLLFGAALSVFLAANLRSRWSGAASLAPLWLLVLPFSVTLPALGSLFFTFLKIGSVLFGSGYVLLAFLRSEFTGPGLLTEQQLIDAVAIGQFTPGPVFTTATFIGYLLHGVPGALAATAGIFLPAFVLVALTGPFIPRLRSSPTLASLLDGVNAAALALMAGVTLQLGQAAIVDPFTAALAVLSLILLLRFRVNSVWLVLGGGTAGLLSAYLPLVG